MVIVAKLAVAFALVEVDNSGILEILREGLFLPHLEKQYVKFVRPSL